MPGGYSIVSDGDAIASPPLHGSMMLKILLLALPMLGVQFAWSVEFAFGTPELLKLGLSRPLLALVWLAGPLSGLIIQPVIGVLSDSSTSIYGRRRPFLIGGSLAMLISIILIAYSRELGSVLSFGNLGSAKNFSILTGVTGFYLLDFSLNAVMASARSLAVDVLPLQYQNSSTIWTSRMTGVGNVLGYLCGFVDLVWVFRDVAESHPTLFGSQLKILCFVCNALLLLCVVPACSLIAETPLQQRGESMNGKSWFSPLVVIFQTMKKMPMPLQQIFNVQFLVWIGWFPFLFYCSAWVAARARRGGVIGVLIDEDSAARAGSFALLLMATVSLVTSATAPLIAVRGRGRSRLRSVFFRKLLCLPGLWAASMFTLGALLIFGTMIASGVTSASIVVAMIGVPWAIANWIPFALISEYVASASEPVLTRADSDELSDSSLSELSYSRRLQSLQPQPLSAGIVLGVHNLYIVIPQLISSVLTSIVFALFSLGSSQDDGTDPSDTFGWILRIGAIATFFAAFNAWRLADVFQ